MELWIAFVGIGLLMILLELVVGVDTGLDLVFVGTAFILGGLVALPFESWILPLIVIMVVCGVYLFLGRRYVHRWTTIRKSKTNVDTIVGRTGIMMQKTSRNIDGRVKVGNEDWKASAAEDVEPGEEVVVTGIRGVTLIVERAKEVKSE